MSLMNLKELRFRHRTLKAGKVFLEMHADEHAAGTEFVIGPLFLTAGVSAFDLIVGLLLGNLLVVLFIELDWLFKPLFLKPLVFWLRF